MGASTEIENQAVRIGSASATVAGVLSSIVWAWLQAPARPLEEPQMLRAYEAASYHETVLMHLSELQESSLFSCEFTSCVGHGFSSLLGGYLCSFLMF